MKVSIVMAYFNRKRQLLNTLKSIEKTSHNNIEIIIVDDASDDDQKLDDLKTDLPLKVVRVQKEEKTWLNPCIPFNKGFKLVTGDLIMIQNPECLHFGDVVKCAVDNSQIGFYDSYACYSIDYQTSMKIKDGVSIGKILTPLNNRGVIKDNENAWYNHSKYRPVGYHFCSTIYRENFNVIKGFDERFKDGIGYDDNEFLFRIQKRFNVRIIDRPFVVHQWHKSTDYSNSELVLKNKLLYQKIRLEKDDNYDISWY